MEAYSEMSKFENLSELYEELKPSQGARRSGQPGVGDVGRRHHHHPQGWQDVNYFLRECGTVLKQV